MTYPHMMDISEKKKTQWTYKKIKMIIFIDIYFLNLACETSLSQTDIWMLSTKIIDIFEW